MDASLPPLSSALLLSFQIAAANWPFLPDTSHRKNPSPFLFFFFFNLAFIGRRLFLFLPVVCWTKRSTIDFFFLPQTIRRFPLAFCSCTHVDSSPVLRPFFSSSVVEHKSLRVRGILMALRCRFNHLFCSFSPNPWRNCALPPPPFSKFFRLECRKFGLHPSARLAFLPSPSPSKKGVPLLFFFHSPL